MKTSIKANTLVSYLRAATKKDMQPVNGNPDINMVTCHRLCVKYGLTDEQADRLTILLFFEINVKKLEQEIEKLSNDLIQLDKEWIQASEEREKQWEQYANDMEAWIASMPKQPEQPSQIASPSLKDMSYEEAYWEAHKAVRRFTEVADYLDEIAVTKEEISNAKAMLNIVVDIDVDFCDYVAHLHPELYSDDEMAFDEELVRLSTLRTVEYDREKWERQMEAARKNTIKNFGHLPEYRNSDIEEAQIEEVATTDTLAADNIKANNNTWSEEQYKAVKAEAEAKGLDTTDLLPF
jgi:hypothetical protein